MPELGISVLMYLNLVEFYFDYVLTISTFHLVSSSWMDGYSTVVGAALI